MSTFTAQEQFMQEALLLAKEAYLAGETPVGAVVVRGGEVIARAENRREREKDPTAHAEILAIREAAQILQRRRLMDCTLYVTLEPCPMCAGALVMAALGCCYFGARDKRQGCVESIYALTREPSFCHRLPCIGGVLAQEVETLMKGFFQERRMSK